MCCYAGNAKHPSILSQMIADAREIRESQAYRHAHATNNAKTFHAVTCTHLITSIVEIYFVFIL